MTPEERENQRYKENDYCEIMLEEKIMFSLLKEWSQENKKEKSNLKVLDLGCGSGLITKEIQKLGYQVKGLDFSQEALKKAVNNGIDAKWCNFDKGIDGENEEFDVIWAGDIIEHVFDPIGLLREANRVLKKEGIIIMTIPNDVGLFNRVRTFFGISYQAAMYKKSGFYKHHTFFTFSLIRYMLKKNNFSIMKYQKILDARKFRLSSSILPSFLYNELVIYAKKK
jgi:2-polyprenyl-3-methyl-5-hydroxy-6-metoxy-1,4-benzoquinol methylase